MRVAAAVIAVLLAAPLFAAKEKAVDPKPKAEPQPTVTIDVKDAEVRDVLGAMQKQCGLRNLVVDSDVSGKATFYFRRVPCSTAFDVVLKTFRLKAVVYSPSVAVVGKNR